MADETILIAQLKNAKEQGIRSLRDKTDIYSADGSLVKIGEHQFSVNKQKLGLTLTEYDIQMRLDELTSISSDIDNCSE